MTPAQKTTLKTAIQADPTANQLLLDGNLDGLATFCNQPASPAFWVWRTFVSDTEIYETVTPAPDNTVWSWSIHIARTQAERDSWRDMVRTRGGINPSLANTRTGSADIYSGPSGLPQRTHLLAIGRRQTTFSEKALAIGTGTTASPGTLTFEGALTYNDFVGVPFQG